MSVEEKHSSELRVESQEARVEESTTTLTMPVIPKMKDPTVFRTLDSRLLTLDSRLSCGQADVSAGAALRMKDPTGF